MDVEVPDPVTAAFFELLRKIRADFLPFASTPVLKRSILHLAYNEGSRRSASYLLTLLAQLFHELDDPVAARQHERGFFLDHRGCLCELIVFLRFCRGGPAGSLLLLGLCVFS